MQIYAAVSTNMQTHVQSAETSLNIPLFLSQMLRVHNQVQTMKVKGQSYEDVCLR